MPEKDPTTWGLATWLLALGMAFGGGAVNWYAKVKRGLLFAIERAVEARLDAVAKKGTK